MNPGGHKVVQKMEALVRLAPRRILLPEGSYDARTLRAAELLAAEGLVHPVITGSQAAVEQLANAEGINLAGIEVIDPAADDALLRELHDVYQQKMDAAG